MPLLLLPLVPGPLFLGPWSLYFVSCTLQASRPPHYLPEYLQVWTSPCTSTLTLMLVLVGQVTELVCFMQRLMHHYAKTREQHQYLILITTFRSRRSPS